MGIVHGNLNEHTVLLCGWKLWLTDFSHVVDRHLLGHEKVLAQDVGRINAYFMDQGLTAGTKKQWIDLLPQDVAMAYSTKQHLGEGFDSYIVRKMYHKELNKGIPFLQRRH